MEDILILTEKQAKRFWSKVSKAPHPKGCWCWTARKNHDGYGTFKFRDNSELAHRMSYRIHHGPIPDGNVMRVLHSCDTRECVNPEHLRLGTQKENAGDREARGRGNQPTGDRQWQRRYPERRLRGSQRLNAKIDEKKAAEIKALLAEGKLNHKEIGALFGVSNYVVFDIKRGRTWTHVKPTSACPQEPKRPAPEMTFE